MREDEKSKCRKEVELYLSLNPYIYLNGYIIKSICYHVLKEYATTGDINKRKKLFLYLIDLYIKYNVPSIFVDVFTNMLLCTYTNCYKELTDDIEQMNFIKTVLEDNRELLDKNKIDIDTIFKNINSEREKITELIN